MMQPLSGRLRQRQTGGGLRVMALGAAGMMLAAAMPAQAQGMTVAEFLAKADMLRKGGAAAMELPDVKQLREETITVMRDYRADIARQSEAGETPHSCPPPRGEARLGSNEVIRAFNAIPPDQRGMSVKDAFYAMMLKRYPCGDGG
jgi:hypothetical protein